MKKNCPYCGTKMRYALRYSRSSKRLKLICVCDMCCIWCYPKKI